MPAEILVGIQNVPVDFDQVALGVRYLERAEPLSPSPDRTRQLPGNLNRIYAMTRQARIRRLPKDGRYQAAMALGDRDRFELLWDLATFSYGLGNSFDADHRTEALAQWEQAARYAEGLAVVAKKYKSDPEYGNAVFNANMMLAFVESQERRCTAHSGVCRRSVESSRRPQRRRLPLRLGSRMCVSDGKRTSRRRCQFSGTVRADRFC